MIDPRNTQLIIWCSVALMSLVPTQCWAQKKAVSDCVVFETGDTIFAKFREDENIFGKIEIANLSGVTEFILTDNKGKYTKYPIDEIHVVLRNTALGLEKYVKVAYSNVKRPRVKEYLMKELISGRVSLYSAEHGDDGFFLLRGGISYPVSKFLFKTEISNYFYDSPALAKRIKRKELRYEDLGKIVSLYNEEKGNRPDLTSFIPGFIELLSGAVLQGKLRAFDEAKSCSKFIFADDSGKLLTVAKEQVKGYRRGREYYVKKTIPSKTEVPKTVYLLQLEKGNVSLYRYTKKFEQTSGKWSPSINYGDIVKLYFERNGVLTYIPSKGFAEAMSAYFSDNEELSAKIKEKQLGIENLDLIISIYNE